MESCRRAQKQSLPKCGWHRERLQHDALAGSCQIAPHPLGAPQHMPRSQAPLLAKEQPLCKAASFHLLRQCRSDDETCHRHLQAPHTSKQ